jgi:O-antigen/teichoic acid export membrane protein
VTWFRRYPWVRLGGVGKLFSGFSIYFGTSLLNRAIPFLLLPVLTRYLSPAEYGLLGIYQVVIAFSMPLAGMQMQNNITRNFFRVTQDEMARVVFNLLLVLITTSTLLLIVLTGYVFLGGELFSVPERWVLVLPVLAFMNMSNEFHLTILRNQRRALSYGLYEISRTILNLSTTLVLVVGFAWGWEGAAMGILVASLCLGSSGVWRLWKDGFLRPEVDRQAIREIWGVSLPLVPHALGAAVITLSDRLFIERMVGTDEVGVYVVGYQFGMVMTLFVTAFNRSWSPWLYEQLADVTRAAKLRIVRGTYAYAAAVFLLATGVTIGSYGLIPFMTAPDFHGATRFVGWVALGYAFHGLYTMVFPYLVHVGRTGPLGLITFVVSGVNLVANYWLIRINGSVGAAQATAFSYLLMFVSVWWYAGRIYPMPWRLR